MHEFISLDLSPQALHGYDPDTDNCYFSATFFKEDDSEEMIIAMMSKRVYNKALRDFFAQKGEYCKQWGHWCGSEMITCDDFDVVGDVSGPHLLTESPTTTVKMYYVRSIDVELEHG